MPSVCRWGILGTADIARKNWKAIRAAGNSTLTAVASRSEARAKQFIDTYQADVHFAPAPVPVGGYDELLRRADVDAIYIPLPTGIRPEWVIKAANAGKHILCEKPCGPTSAEVRAMLDACTKHKVQFMDGVMFMHSGRLPILRKVLDDGESVGAIRRITSQFSFQAPPEFMQNNIRVSNDLEPLGALGDLGWYNLRFTLWAMKYRMPERVSGRILAEHGTGKVPVPTEFSGELFFSGEVSASFYCSFLTQIQQWAHISGTRGSISLQDFVLPYYGAEAAFEVSQPASAKLGCTFRMEQHIQRYASRECSEGVPGAQEVNMIQKFSEIVLSGKTDPAWGEIALKTQLVLDACLQSAREGGKLVKV
jgi:predicted dehydrogenase